MKTESAKEPKCAYELKKSSKNPYCKKVKMELI